MGKTSLRRLFFRYLCYIVCWLAFSVLLMVNLPYIKMGVLYPANTGEKKLAQTITAIEKTDKISEIDIPYYYDYSIFDEKNNCIKSNIPANKEKKFKEYKTATSHRTTWNTYVHTKETKYGKLVISYRLVADFTNPTLYKYLPPGEYLLLALSIIVIVVGFLLISGLFGKRITKELRLLVDVTDKVSHLDLDFEAGQSNVKEINTVLNSVDKMREGLKVALNAQWQTEKNMKESTQALTHDIKTPLTIIKGNCELLSETELDEEQEMYLTFINNHLNRMNYYVEELTTISGLSEEVRSGKKEYSASFVNQQIKPLIEELVAEKDLNVIFEEEKGEEILFIHLNEVLRAIQNVVTNGVDYTPKKGDFYIHSYSFQDQYRIEIVDSGPGFSKEALEKGFSDFFTEEKSRSQGEHYGLGLSIARKMIEKNQGIITLENEIRDGQTCGGKVCIQLPLNSTSNHPG